jgi:hypothetical protein
MLLGVTACASTRVRKHPPFFGRGLLRVRPTADCITRLYYGGDQPCDLEPMASSKAKFGEVAVISRKRSPLPWQSWTPEET